MSCLYLPIKKEKRSRSGIQYLILTVLNLTQRKGKWVGTWKFSKSFEKMLRRMIAPNADLRSTAKDIMVDAYWGKRVELGHSHSHSMWFCFHFACLLLSVPTNVASYRTFCKRLLPIHPPRHGYVQTYGYQLALVRAARIILIIKGQREQRYPTTPYNKESRPAEIDTLLLHRESHSLPVAA